MQRCDGISERQPLRAAPLGFTDRLFAVLIANAQDANAL
jgi:hypothetical protein